MDSASIFNVWHRSFYVVPYFQGDMFHIHMIKPQSGRGTVLVVPVVCVLSRRRTGLRPLLSLLLLCEVLTVESIPLLKGECSFEMLGADDPSDEKVKDGRNLFRLESLVEFVSVRLSDVSALPVLLILRIGAVAPPNPTSRLVPLRPRPEKNDFALLFSG